MLCAGNRCFLQISKDIVLPILSDAGQKAPTKSARCWNEASSKARRFGKVEARSIAKSAGRFTSRLPASAKNLR